MEQPQEVCSRPALHKNRPCKIGRTRDDIGLCLGILVSGAGAAKCCANILVSLWMSN